MAVADDHMVGTDVDTQNLGHRFLDNDIHTVAGSMNKEVHVDGDDEEDSSSVEVVVDAGGKDLGRAGNLDLEPLVLEDRERVDILVRRSRMAL